jgi:hypothetical protein
MSKMDISAVFEMFEAINSKLDKRNEKPTEAAQIDLTAVNTVTERLENMIDEVRKPAKTEHKHRHTIEIGSSSVFILLVVMALAILGLSYGVGEQRRIISRYKDNDLKYRYIKMQGQTYEENIYHLERQFKHGDSIKIIRKQVERYEELVKEQAERMERERQNSEEIERLRQEAETVKSKE